MNILVTGANGQLGMCIKDVAKHYPNFSFVFTSRNNLDISNFDQLSQIFTNNSFDFLINCAAYTNVEKAESDAEKAFQINAEAIKNMAILCEKNEVTFIQISTDYVFNGEKTTPYHEEDKTGAINVYGASKLKGENYTQEYCSRHYILRTSWLYSQYGHNFYNSIIKFAKEGRDLKITTEQTGTPTNANDLAKAILLLISSNKKSYGIYHTSNTGKGTWYDFAKVILDHTQQLNTIKLEKTDHYRTFAARPKYSVLDTSKLKNTFNINLPNWKTSIATIKI